jgi:hypothetical protein
VLLATWLRVMVADYDHEFENVVLRGWQSVKEQSAVEGYFNESFRSYIEDRFVADTFKRKRPAAAVYRAYRRPSLIKVRPRWPTLFTR